MCNVCGIVKESLKLNEREWTCPDCGTFHDRDFNAALNLKNYSMQNTPTVGEIEARGEVLVLDRLCETGPSTPT
jgi:putative transposase